MSMLAQRDFKEHLYLEIPYLFLHILIIRKSKENSGAYDVSLDYFEGDINAEFFRAKEHHHAVTII